MNIIFLSLAFFTNSNLVQLQSQYGVTEIVIPSKQGDFGFGAYFSYQPLIFSISEQKSLIQYFLCELKILNGNTLLRQSAEFSEANKTIQHYFQINNDSIFIFDIDILDYEGQWYYFYITYSLTKKLGNIMISSVNQNNKAYFNIQDLELSLDQDLQFTIAGTFSNDPSIQQFFPGYIFQIQSINQFDESSILLDKSKAKCTCSTDYSCQNLNLQTGYKSYIRGQTNAICYDYAIQSWIQLSQDPDEQIEIINLSHSIFNNFYNSQNGHACDIKYQIIDQLLQIKISLYSYQFPIILPLTTDQQVITLTFDNLEVNTTKWHYFRFQKVNKQAQIDIYFPYESLSLVHTFNEVYQFSSSKLTYYLGGNSQSIQTNQLQFANFTILNCYQEQQFNPPCHIFCKTCSGPTQYHCTSCNNDDNRELKNNYCYCKLGYSEIYLSQCLSSSNQYFKIITEDITLPIGYEQLSPNLRCQFGYFQFQGKCLKCPGIQNEYFISCTQCLLHQQNWATSLQCSFNQIKQDNIFIRQIEYHYFVLDNTELQEIINGYPSSSGFLSKYIQNGNPITMYCSNNGNEGNCYKTFQNIENQCGQFCQSCTNGYCNYCFDQYKYFITSDGINCEICSIKNCKYCYIFDIIDSEYQTLSSIFQFRNRNIDTLRIGCAQCIDGYSFNFNTLLCEIIQFKDCLQSYINQDNSIICNFSKSSDLSNVIYGCQEFMNFCLICYKSPYTSEVQCLKCLQGYYILRSERICQKCNSKVQACQGYTYGHQDFWKEDIEPFYFTQYFRIQLYDQIQYVMYSICDESCDTCQQYTYKCKKCKLSDQGIQKFNIGENQKCIDCPYLCSSCQDIVLNSDFEINPYYSNIKDDYMGLNTYRQCLLADTSKNKNIYISGSLFPVLCSNNKPCIQYGIQKGIYTCLQYNAIVLSRLFSQLDQGIDLQVLINLSVERFVFYIEIIYQTEVCSTYLNLISSLKTYVSVLKIIDLSFTTNFSKFVIQIPNQISNFNNIFIYNSYLQEGYQSEDTTQLIHTNDYQYTDIRYHNIVFDSFKQGIKMINQNTINFEFINITLINSIFNNLQIIQFTKNVTDINLSKIVLQNLMIQNCIFNNSILFSISELFAINPTILIDNLIIQNCTLQNSIFMEHLNNTYEGYLFINNITIIQSNLINTKLFEFNMISLGELTIFNVINSTINESHLLNFNQINMNQLTFNNNLFINSVIFQQEQNNLQNYTIKNIEINNNIFQGSQNWFKFKDFGNIHLMDILIINNIVDSDTETNENSFIYLYEGFQCQITEMVIYQNQFQFNIIQAIIIQSLAISNVSLKILSNLKNYISISEECLHLNKSSSIFFSILDVVELNFQNFIIKESNFINNPFISITNTFKSEQQIIIQFSNFEFEEISEIKLDDNLIMSLIIIQSDLITQIIISNFDFKTIWMHQYSSNLEISSSNLLSISSHNSNVKLNNLNIYDALITNTSDPNIFIECNHLDIQNIFAQNINILNINKFGQYIQWDFDTYNLYLEDLQTYFLINSFGGIFNILSNYTYISQLTVIKTLAQLGGTLYFSTKNQGIIIINNCIFQNSQANIRNENSQGGTIYIDSSRSLLNLKLQQSSISDSYSSQYGGIIYLIPSQNQNQISLEDLDITKCFSIQGSIFYAQFYLQAQSQIYIRNITATSLSITHYIQNIPQILSLKAQQLIDNSYAFEIINGKQIIFQDFLFTNSHLVGFVYIYNYETLRFNNIRLMNFNLTKQNFITINQNINNPVSFYITKMIIFNGYYLNNLIPISEYSCQSKTFQINSFSCNQLSIQPNNLISYFNIHQQVNEYCNLKEINDLIQQSEYTDLISIQSIISPIQLTMNEINVININLDLYNKGLLSLSINNKLTDNKINIKNVNFQENQCGIYGCISLINSNNLTSLESLTQNLSQVIVSQEQNYIIEEIDEINLEYLYFSNNSAQFGGAIFIIGLPISIDNSIFHNNTAIQGGGGIYYQSEQVKLIISRTSFLLNQAQIGIDIFLKGNQPQNYLKYLRINDYKISSQPYRLQLQVNKELLPSISITKSNITYDYVDIQPYQIFQKQQIYLMVPSGQKISEYSYFQISTQEQIPMNISFQLIALNELNQEITNLQGSQCKLYIKESSQQVFSYLNDIYFDYETKGYNLDSQKFIFDPYKSDDQYLEVKIECNSIYQQNYAILFQLQTFECQMGEFYYQDQCLICNPDQSYYSLNPLLGKCQIMNQETTLEIKSSMIKLKQGYWRYQVQSDQISSCFNKPNNCQGGWKVGDETCKIGYSGALCEECDLWNKRGSGKYGKTADYNCVECDEFSGVYVKAIIYIIWFFLTIYLTCFSVNKSNQQIEQNKLLNKHFKLLHNLNIDKTGIIVKMIANFIQIVSAISSFHLTMNLNLDFSFEMIGNPVKTVITALDCQLSSLIFTNLPYYRILLLVTCSCLSCNIGIFIYFIYLAITKEKYNTGNIWTMAIFIYIFTQPNLLSDLMSLLSYRNINGIYWVKGDMTLIYTTTSHTHWMIFEILPITLIIGWILPIMVMFVLYKNRKKLFEKRVRKRFSYLYNEYKESIWFWEIIKIFLRALIIININIYSDNQFIKATQIFLTILLYYVLLNIYQPYQIKTLNKLETRAILISILSIILAVAAYETQQINNPIQYFYKILMIIMLILQMIAFIYELSITQLRKLQQLIEQWLYLNIHKIKLRLVKDKIEYYIKSKLTKKKTRERRLELLKSYLRVKTKQISFVKSSSIQDYQQYMNATNKLNQKQEEKEKETYQQEQEGLIIQNKYQIDEDTKYLQKHINISQL